MQVQGTVFDGIGPREKSKPRTTGKRKENSKSNSFDCFQTEPRQSAEFLIFNQSFLFKEDSENTGRRQTERGGTAPRAATATFAGVSQPKLEERRLAGAGGFEPPNAGIKIRCLTTWLRPNMRPYDGAARGRDHTG